MTAFKVKVLENATEDQLNEIVTFCTKAFNGPAIKAFLGGNWSLHYDLQMAILRASLLDGLVYVVAVGQGAEEKIVSCGQWFPPGRNLFESEEQRALGFNHFMERVSPKTRDWWSCTYPQISGPLLNKYFTKEERSKCWWCYNLATDPEHFGKGYATAIMDTMLEKATKENYFIALATDSDLNVKKYVSMGFTHLGGGIIPAPTGEYFTHFLSKLKHA